MSSLLRRQQRAIRRKVLKNWEPAPVPFRYHPDGSYEVLRPTKGWLRVSAARLRAQFRLSQIHAALNRTGGQQDHA